VAVPRRGHEDVGYGEQDYCSHGDTQSRRITSMSVGLRLFIIVSMFYLVVKPGAAAAPPAFSVPPLLLSCPQGFPQ
jgi:hypothetical protein